MLFFNCLLSRADFRLDPFACPPRRMICSSGRLLRGGRRQGLLLSELGGGVVGVDPQCCVVLCTRRWDFLDRHQKVSEIRVDVGIAGFESDGSFEELGRMHDASQCRSSLSQPNPRLGQIGRLRRRLGELLACLDWSTGEEQRPAQTDYGGRIVRVGTNPVVVGDDGFVETARGHKGSAREYPHSI